MTGARDRGADGPEPPGGDPEEIERRWREIVADLGPLGTGTEDPDAGAAPPHPSSSPGPFPEAFPGPQGAPPGGRGPRDRPAGDGTGKAGQDDGLEDGLDASDEFVPPEPPALGSGDPAVVLSLVGVAGAPAALLLLAILWPGAPGIVLGVLVGAFVAGAVGLFLTLPRDRDREGPGNGDGAQV
ncbi:hypothetical protein E7744_06175 [Citricoccus sp. SGAir0253]|uniref:hypothetical protein n=1 Tax=Citricoccus sp. SGAir0253 TaxID=2567881 RepID=UPI0010CCFF7D|nr:hypothetical protein [Citricoccus sp. SGAir0253]QCU77822.1 hypothetical protein E7744_06175 [Citricoccus sp. SGAir0253]